MYSVLPVLIQLQSEDTIKNGPVLSVDDLASKFQQILFNKVAMVSASQLFLPILNLSRISGQQS